MSFESILAIILVAYLRKSLRTISPNEQRWNQILTFTLYGVVALVILQFVFHITPIVKWVWYALLFFFLYLINKNPVFDHFKKLLYAVLPLVLLGFFSDLLKAIQPAYYDRVNNYVNLAFGVTITWMIATIRKSNKQQKALEAEREKTHAEEERSKFIAAQKDDLEVLVNERTAEISKQKDDLQHALTELRETQALLIQSEKMASLGELTAGIAHEIQNPLNFVNNFAEVNAELIEELKTERSKPKAERDDALEMEILNDIKQNLEKINHHGKRADAIVKGMLEHSRISTGVKEPTDINALADEYFRLSYHGLRAKDKSFNADMKTDFDTYIGKLEVVAQDIGRVLLNLFNNAFYAVTEKARLSDNSYQPIASVTTKKSGNHIIITVNDNGNGIPQNVIDKIFQPFFTTKPTGEGTGLGLSLSYDIIKAHGGQIKVESVEGEGTSFIIELPIL
ncbi:MAG TPA: ATP-binding protein [Hanamia sp.]